MKCCDSFRYNDLSVKATNYNLTFNAQDRSVPRLFAKNIWPTDILAGARTFGTTTLGKMTLTITTFSMMTLGLRIECHCAECHVFLLLGWTSSCWVSLCWMSWRNFDRQALVRHRHDPVICPTVCRLASVFLCRVDPMSVGQKVFAQKSWSRSLFMEIGKSH
jgi:hypothetical protein